MTEIKQTETSSTGNRPAGIRTIEAVPDGPGGDRPHVVLVVENESVPTDPRIWAHARLLRDGGHRVTVICPVGIERDHARHEVIDDITIHRFPLNRAEDGIGAYLTEYATALVRMTIAVNRVQGPVSVIQVANPPDLLGLVTIGPRLRWRSKVVFDHHDLVPELFQARFGRAGIVRTALQACERLNFKLADAVISTNESYRRIAIDRGGRHPDQVRVVRNARNPADYQVEPDPALKRGKRHLAVYVGVIGPQDGGDLAVRVAADYRHRLGRDDIHVAIIGDGAAAAECRRLAAELDVEDMVEFTGWLGQPEVRRYLATADIGLATDPPTPFNKRSTMIKVVEYLAAGIPVVSFDLDESRITAGDAALYASDGAGDGSMAGNITAMADDLKRLADDPELRARMGAEGLRRAIGPLGPDTSRNVLLATYGELISAWRRDYTPESTLRKVLNRIRRSDRSEQVSM